MTKFHISRVCRKCSGIISLSFNVASADLGFRHCLATALEGGETWDHQNLGSSSDGINLHEVKMHWLRSAEWNLPRAQLFTTTLVTLHRLRSVSTIIENHIFNVSFNFYMIFYKIFKIPWYFHDWKSWSFFKAFQVTWELCLK